MPFPAAAEQADAMQSSNGVCYDFALDGYDEVRAGREGWREDAGAGL